MRINALAPFAIALAALACTAAQAQSEPPNILFLISDDVGVDVSTDMYPGLIDELLEQYGPNGHDHPDYARINGQPASLPSLTELANGGMRFTNVWAQPFCSPTRATILTGLYAQENKVTTYLDALSENHTSFVQILSDAGYSTGLFGKWHLAGIGDYTGMHPKQAGFDVFRGNMGAALNTFWDYEYSVQDADTAPDELRTEALPAKSLPGMAESTYAPLVKTAEAIEWIEARENEDPDKPWFTWLAFNLSHATSSRTPSQMIIPNRDTLDPVSLAEIEACTDTFATADLGNCSPEAVMRAMTTSLDTVLGTIIDAVDELDPNTYIIYVGDNGTPMYGRPGLDFIDNMYITRTARGKGTAYEGGALVPMVVRGPGIEAGTESRQFAHTADLFSTILALAGLDIPATVADAEGSRQVPLDAVNLAPILFGTADSVRNPANDYVLTESHNLMTEGTEQVGARNATHKIICTHGTAAENCEFYDIVGDPLEQYPLDKPASCSGYSSGDWTAADSRWQFCRLAEVVNTSSFMGG